MSGHLPLKPFILFVALILSVAWSSPAMSASDAKKDQNPAAPETKKDKQKKPTSEAKKSESVKKSEAPKKAEQSPKKADQVAKKADESAIISPDESSKRPDEAAKKTDELDPLQACLARIPKEGTFGQQMLAEQSCNREDERRKQSGSAARF